MEITLATARRPGERGAMTSPANGAQPQASAIPAATLVLFRHPPQGGAPQLLMIERGAHMRFAAGAVVFPGGRIDPADRALAAAVAPQLDPDDAAARIAAIRETLEETGLLAGVSQTVTVDLARSARDCLTEVGALGEMLDRFGLTLDLAALVPFARWCPPWERAFDTRFYLADLGTGDVALVEDGSETVHLFWASAQDTLGMIERGEARALFPTVCNLERLAAFTSYAHAATAAEALPPALICPWIEAVDGIDHLCIPENAGYPVTRRPLSETSRGGA